MQGSFVGAAGLVRCLKLCNRNPNSPLGPGTQILCALAPKYLYLYRDYLKAKVYPILGTWTLRGRESFQ